MSAVKACGIDIVQIARVRRVYLRYPDRFLARVCGSWERERAGSRPDPAPFLAGRFAVKEAVLKVLGVGLFAGVRLADIEVRAHDSGEPYCVLHGTAAARAAVRGITRVLVSISHSDEHAVAQALGVGE